MIHPHLFHIGNWIDLARQAGWSVTTLAQLCGVSANTLRRHFHRQMGKRVKVWLAEQRQQQAIELLKKGSSVKETAACLGYKHQTNFTRKFKQTWGTIPSRECR